MGYSLESYIPRNTLVNFCKRYYIRKLSLFGSAIRNELQPDSDIDILVEFDKDHIPSLFTIARIENEFSVMLGRTADVRTPEDLSRYFRDEVVREAVVQYEE